MIAVEVHQNDPDSSDLSFDLQLMSNTLDMEETVAAIDLGVLKQDIGRSTPRAEFENWMWEELDLARQPKRSTKQPEDILETGRRLLLNGIEVPRLLEQPRPRRRVILQPPTPN